jgi:dihydroflavonol-4-reductase
VRSTLAAIGVDLARVEVRPADLLDPASLPPLLSGATHVFHTASLYDYSAPLDRLLRVNVIGTRNLLAAAARAKLERFVHWSTCGVFGKPYTAADRGKTNLPFTEQSPSPKTEPTADGPSGTELVNDYSIAKWRQEQLVWRAYREGLPVTVVRPAPIYGPGSAYGHGGIMLAIAHGIVPAIPTDAKNYITTSVHVEDVARFACFIAERDAIGEDYNIVDNSIISYYEFVHYIALLCGRRLRDLPFINLRRARRVMIPAAQVMTWLERRFGIRRLRVFEPQSAEYVSSSYWLSNRKSLATGFTYRYGDVREGLKDTIAWMRETGWLADRRRLFTAPPPRARVETSARGASAAA